MGDAFSALLDKKLLAFPGALPETKPVTIGRLQHLYETNETPLEAETCSLSILRSIKQEELVVIEDRIAAIERHLAENIEWQANAPVEKTASDIADLSSDNSAEPCHEARVRSLAEEDQALADERKDLLPRRLQTQRAISICSTILSPIRTIPAEVLCEIILFAIDSYSDAMADKVSTTSSGYYAFICAYYRLARWAMTAVCRRWREITINVRHLWSRVYLVCHKRAFFSTNSDDIFAAELTRAGDLPLTVGLFLLAKTDPAADILIAQVVALSARWQRLIFYAHDSDDYDHLPSIQGRLPLLKSLHIWGIAPKTDLSHFVAAPKLLDISIIPIALPFIALPMSQIVDFSTSNEATISPIILSYLKHTPALVRCQLSCAHVNPAIFMALPQAQVTLAHMTSLCLRVVRLEDQVEDTQNIDTVAQLLDYLVLPALKSLELHDIVELDGVVSAKLRSSFQLEHLSLTSPHITAEQCLELFEQLPTMHVLHLECPKVFTAAFFEKMRDEKMLPELRSLFLKGEFGDVQSFIDEVRDARSGLRAEQHGLQITFGK
ncbi:hypothetical protein C8J56DRAFT_1168503 [Mycena floridula]|nr:hypothetical protein C8J56DRAFT_1168503 [Mycena floridula]